MLDFTGLERAVLAAICDEHQSIGRQLRGLLETAQLLERDNTGDGFYTTFEVDKGAPPIAWPERMVGGPNAEVEVDDETLLMGFVLWIEGGYPDCLEGYQYGTPSGDNIDLRHEDLSGLAWLRPMS